MICITVACSSQEGKHHIEGPVDTGNILQAKHLGTTIKRKENSMRYPHIVSRDEWRVARNELLITEKQVTRARDKLNAERRRLPMVKIDKTYLFGGPDGTVSLFDLFDGRHQLIVYHFMFDPKWDEGCLH
jgi:predicted dithiol-disulfide oxidoreductase (DUF899 family)